jgi:molecular chaperone DnaK
MNVEAPFVPYEGGLPYLFVSYAHVDRPAVYPELQRLQRLGYRIWYDRGIGVGEAWPESVATALLNCSSFLLFATKAASASKNVRDEINLALDTGKPIVAIHLEADALAGGLRLRLGSVQAILKFELSELEFQLRLREALPASLVTQARTAERLDHGRVLGIDFGTTNTVVAIWTGNEPRVILNREGDRSTPSVVAWTPAGEWIVGEAAVAQAHTNYENTFYSIKSKLGTGFEIERGGRSYSAADLVAMILRKLREDAALYLRFDIRKAVVTHPVGFNLARKQELARAFQSAGFEIVRIVPEPTAVSLMYYDPHQRLGKALIYDLGGGSFDVSVVYAETDEIIQCQSVGGDVALGGDDFDRILAEHCLAGFETEHGAMVRNDPAIVRRVMSEVERAKKILCGGAIKAHVELPYLKFHDGSWRHLSQSITLDELVELTKPLVARTLTLCERARAVAIREFPKQLECVILTGLATKVPGIRDELRRRFGLEPLSRVDSAEAVALGAALYGEQLVRGKDGDILLINLLPMSIGVETIEGVLEVLMPANTTTPNTRSRDFEIVGDDERIAHVNIFEGERPMAADNSYWGSIEFAVGPKSGGSRSIELTVSCDANHVVTVSVIHRESGKTRERKFTPSEFAATLDPVSRPEANLQSTIVSRADNTASD